MDIFDKAKELGQMIASSPKMERLKRAEAQVEADEKAKSLLTDYKAFQIEMMKSMREDAGKEALDAAKKMLINKQKEINEYEVTREYFEAKSDYESFVKKVNDVIIFGITGEEERCSPSKCGSCSSGCSC